MKHRRNLLAAAGLAAVGAHPLARSQVTARMRRVGILSLSTAAGSGHLYDSFKLGMRDLGWIEGQNVEYLVVYTQGKADANDTLARDLVAKKVDVIVSAGEGIRAAQSATTTIPIVMAVASAVVQLGFVASLAKPGGNITGITVEYETIVQKFPQLILELAPSVRRVAVLLNDSTKFHQVFWQAIERASAVLGVVPVRITANSAQQIEAAFFQAAKEKVHGIIVPPDGMLLAERAILAKSASSLRLPSIYAHREHVAAGGLICYGANLGRMFRYSAKFVDRILKGANPATLPVELPTKYDVVVNMKVAKALGLTIPQSILLRADEVIE